MVGRDLANTSLNTISMANILVGIAVSVVDLPMAVGPSGTTKQVLSGKIPASTQSPIF